MMFNYATDGIDYLAWPDGNGELPFIPTFVVEWDGSAPNYNVVYGTMPVIPESSYTDEQGNVVAVPAHPMGIPMAGWPQTDIAPAIMVQP